MFSAFHSSNTTLLSRLAGLDLNPFRLHFLGLGHSQGQHTVVIGGDDLVGVDRNREAQAAAEAAEATLADVVGLFLDGLVFLYFALYGEDVVLQGHIQVFGVDARQRSLDGERVTLLGYVQGQAPAAHNIIGAQGHAHATVKRSLKHAIKLVEQVGRFAHRVPAN